MGKKEFKIGEVFQCGLVKLECKFKPFDKVLARECRTDKWRADLFSHMNEEGEFTCIGYLWNECIPYNEQTKHLLGTTHNWEE